MIYHEQSEDYRPLFWMGGRPIYAYTLIIILHVLAFIAVAISLSAAPLMVDDLALAPYMVTHHIQIWRLFTYIVFPPSIWFIFAMGFFYFAAREVEQFVGWKTFLKLYAALIFIPAVVLSLVDLLSPVDPVIGGLESIFGVFVAFATIYPGVVINFCFTSFTAKGWSWVLLGAYTLIDLATHSWSSMILLWSAASIGYMGMRLIGAGRGFNWLTDWLDERRTQKLIKERNFKVLENKKETESIDSILEKISKHGVSSLNAREKAALEQARAKLLERDQR